MRVRRTKYKRTTPKTRTEFSKLDLDLGRSFDRLINTVVEIMTKFFGHLYLSKSADVLR